MSALHSSLENMEDKVVRCEKVSSQWLPVGDVLLENLDNELQQTRVSEHDVSIDCNFNVIKYLLIIAIIIIIIILLLLLLYTCILLLLISISILLYYIIIVIISIILLLLLLYYYHYY